MRHAVCGGDFVPLLTCGSCSETVSEKDVVAQWGPSGSWARSIPAAVTRRRSGGREAAGRAVPADDDRARQPVGVRDSGRRVRRGEPVHRLSDTARCPAGLDRGPAWRSSWPTGCWSAADNRYRLTEKGRALFPVLISALQWAQRWFPRARRTGGGAHTHGVRPALHRGHDLRPMRPAVARNRGLGDLGTTRARMCNTAPRDCGRSQIRPKAICKQIRSSTLRRRVLISRCTVIWLPARVAGSEEIKEVNCCASF